MSALEEWSETVKLIISNRINSLQHRSFLPCHRILEDPQIKAYLTELQSKYVLVPAHITKAFQFSNSFRYVDDLFSINNVNFGNCISAIYPSELELKDTSTSSTEVCYLDTNIKTGDVTTPFRISIYDKRDDFAFRIVNFPHMDSNIPANPAYSVYMSQLVRYARICTSKVDFINRLCHG